MIVFLVTREHSYTIGRFLEDWAPEIANRFEIVPYEDLPRRDSLPAGAVVFADLERLRAPGLELACEAAAQLAASPLRPLVLNDPRRARRRRDLLRMLWDQEVNDFNAYRLSELPSSVRFPVFLRGGSDHSGPRSPQLHTRTELERAVCLAAMWGFDPRDLLVVEYLDTIGPDGLYRKYGAFVLAGRIVPKNLFHAPHPWVKKPDHVDDATRVEAKQYIEENPHAEVLSRIASDAGIDYGRFDYAMLDGRPQIWELNTNPVVEMPPGQSRWRDIDDHRRSAARMAGLFIDLDERAHSKGRLLLRLDPPRRIPRPRASERISYRDRPLRRRARLATAPFARALHRPLFPLLVRLAGRDPA